MCYAGRLWRARPTATLLAGRWWRPGRQKSLALCSTGSDAACCRGGRHGRQESPGPALVESCNKSASISNIYKRRSLHDLLTVAQQVTVLFYRHQCCFNKQLSNKQHIFTALSIFPCTTVPCVNTHTQHISIYPVLTGTEATIKPFIDIE